MTCAGVVDGIPCVLYVVEVMICVPLCVLEAVEDVLSALCAALYAGRGQSPAAIFASGDEIFDSLGITILSCSLRLKMIVTLSTAR